MLRRRIRLTLVLGMTLTHAVIASAQEPSSAPGPDNAASPAQVLDQLIEQNQQLERQNQQIEQQNQQLQRQNRQLIEQVKALRGSVTQPQTASDQAARSAPAQTTAD